MMIDWTNPTTCVEDVLQGSDHALRMLIEAAPVGLVIVTEQQDIVLVNRAATQMFEYAAAELIGQPLDVLIPEMQRERHRKHTAGFFAAPRIRPMGAGLDLWARRKDASTFPVEISLGAVDTRQGQWVMAFIVDVTVRREADALREAMIHTMVHDLRSPLGNIMTALKIIQMDAPDPDAEKQQLLEIALNGAEKLLDLVNAILDVNRLESGKMPLERKEVSLHLLVEDALKMLTPQATGKRIALHQEIPPTLPTVWADAQLIGRVLQNLIGNALKFTPSGGAVQLTGVLLDGADKVQIAISDTGPGIPVQIREQIFQKFVTGLQEGHGSGLGLAFCKMVLEAHHERLWVESEPGHGATFAFTLSVERMKSVDSLEEGV